MNKEKPIKSNTAAQFSQNGAIGAINTASRPYIGRRRNYSRLLITGKDGKPILESGKLIFVEVRS